jgi:hypothetical protein
VQGHTALAAPAQGLMLGTPGEGWVLITPGHARVPGTGRRSPGHGTVAKSEGGALACLGSRHRKGPAGTARKERAAQNWVPGLKMESPARGAAARNGQLETAICFLANQKTAGCVSANRLSQ